MNNFNIYKKKEGKGNINLNKVNNRYKNWSLLSQKTKNQLGSNKIKRNNIIRNIENIKNKYGFNSLNQKIIYNKIQILKNKYINNNYNYNSNSNSKINSIDENTINVNVNNNMNENIIKGEKNLLKSSFSLQYIKENNVILNNFYHTLRNKRSNNAYEINNNNHNRNYKSLDNKQINKNILKEFTKENIQNKNNDKTNRPKLGHKFKYLKNTREDYIRVGKKINELLKNELFNKRIKKGFNAIFPISKKINMLNEVKNDIKNVKDALLNPKTARKFSSSQTGVHPKINSEKRVNLFYELFNDENENNNIKDENKITKPSLIRSLSKPKLDIPNYNNFYSI